MIKVRNRPAEPVLLADIKAEWLPILIEKVDLLSKIDKITHKEDYDKLKKEIDTIKSKYNDKGKIVKNTLKLFSTKNKCMYCESIITATDDGDIEHFEYKDKYSQRVFDWDNLLLSCNRCNRQHKEGEKSYGKHTHDVLLEPLIHPEKDEPETCFKYNNGLIEAQNGLPTTPIATRTINVLGLWRYELVAARNNVSIALISIIEDIAFRLDRHNGTVADTEMIRNKLIYLKSLATDGRPYAGLLRCFFATNETLKNAVILVNTSIPKTDNYFKLL